jgi:hypothetical protein
LVLVLILDLLLSVEPNNMQARSLKTLIEQAVTRDAYVGEWSSTLCGFGYVSRIVLMCSGMGIVATGVAVTGIVAAAIFKRATRK